MSEKNYLNILRGGVFLSFIVLFFVFSSLLFPFISSKQLSFNILIEVLLVILIIFLIKYPKYLPKKSYLTWGLVAYFIAIAMSLVVSVDFNLSFWGDIERMLGFFHLLHFLIFYFIIITAFRTRQDYQKLLNVLIGSAVSIALYGIFKKVPHSTIGNVAYVAAIMLFAMFLQLLFFIKSNKLWIKLLYVLGFIITFISFIKADISGSHAGLMAGALVSILVLTIVSKNKKLKIISFSSLLVLVVLIISLFSLRSSSVFDGTYIGKALRDFSTDNITLNTRLISYQSAGKYLVDHPISMIFGVGHGNYAMIFDKYFNPKFYDYDRHATYFDRAHSNPIDIITTTGILGLLTYLSIFVFLVIYLVRAYRIDSELNSDRRINKIELSLLLGLLSAYFVQNLAVFDSFATYLYLMVILAFINYLGVKNEVIDDYKKEFKIKSILQRVVLPIVSVVVFLSLINNINSFAMIKKTIDAYIISHNQGIVAGSEKYAEVFQYRTGLERDAREAYINLILGSSDQITNAKNLSDAEKVVKLAIEAAEKNESYNQRDSLILTRLSKIYELAGRFYFLSGDQEKGSYYSSLSMDALNRSIESSPGRAPLYLSRANIYLNFNQREDAISDIEYSKSLNPRLAEPHCQLAHFYFIEENHDKFIENFNTCGELRGFYLMNWGNFISLVENYYTQNNKIDYLINFYNIILNFQAEEVDIISKLSLLYYQVGEFDLARETAELLLDIDLDYQGDVDLFLEKINQAQLDLQ